MKLQGSEGFTMSVRTVIVAASLLAASSAIAEPMNADAARRFVAGKVFAYTCFDGTRGSGRIFSDGSVTGTIQIKGAGPVKYATLPANTLRVKGDTVCASVRGIPFEPCFNLNKTNEASFRGSVSGLGFAYCDFTRRGAPSAVRTTWRARPSHPTSLEPPTVAAQAAAE
jgi:hypothetical protein